MRNQPLLLQSIPPFQLFLAINRVRNIVVRLKPNQSMTSVLFAESFEDSLLVLPNSFTQVARHSNVQDAGDARDHVHEKVTLSPHNTQLSSRPSELISFADQFGHGGTCCSRALQSSVPFGGSGDGAGEQQVPRLRIARFANDLLRSG